MLCPPVCNPLQNLFAQPVPIRLQFTAFHAASFRLPSFSSYPFSRNFEPHPYLFALFSCTVRLHQTHLLVAEVGKISLDISSSPSVDCVASLWENSSPLADCNCRSDASRANSFCGE